MNLMCRYFKYAGHLKIWISYIDGKTWKWVGAWLKSYINIKSIFFPKGLSHDPSGYILTESAYIILRFCYKTMKQKSDKLIWKFWNRKKSDCRRTGPVLVWKHEWGFIGIVFNFDFIQGYVLGCFLKIFFRDVLIQH